MVYISTECCGDDYINYSHALSLAKLKSLKERLTETVLNFSTDTLDHVKWFKPALYNVRTRSEGKIVKGVPFRTTRFYKSPILSVVRILNLNKKKVEEARRKPKFVYENNLLKNVNISTSNMRLTSPLYDPANTGDEPFCEDEAAKVSVIKCPQCDKSFHKSKGC